MFVGVVQGSLRLLQKKRTEGRRRAENIASERHGDEGSIGVAMMGRRDDRLVTDEKY